MITQINNSVSLQIYEINNLECITHSLNWKWYNILKWVHGINRPQILSPNDLQWPNLLKLGYKNNEYIISFKIY